MWHNVDSAIQFFFPDKIEDASQKTTDIKLAIGIVVGFLLIAMAFTLLMGKGQLISEKFGKVEITNATIFVLLGVFFLWLTVTKVGIKTDDK